MADQEVVRRRRNTHGEEKREQIESDMTKFMTKLKLSGYGRETRWEILKSGTKRYNRMLEEEKRGKGGFTDQGGREDTTGIGGSSQKRIIGTRAGGKREVSR